MTTTAEFTLEAATRFLQSVVFVDDEIYADVSGKPELSAGSLDDIGAPLMEAGTSALAKENPETELQPNPPYHPKQMVESFARHGIVCALYEPAEGFATDVSSDLFKLCDRADIVILDWDLYKRDGDNIVPLIKNLVDIGQSSVPHHVRLCVIYTSRPDLEEVVSRVHKELSADASLSAKIHDTSTIVAGATRVVVFGKPNVSGRTKISASLVVDEAELANRVISEFSKMNSSLLATYALHGMASVRRNTKRIVDKFSADLDGAFFVNRALTLGSGDGFDQLPELLSEEVLAVMQDEQIPVQKMIDLAEEFGRTGALDVTKIPWQVREGQPKETSEALARRFLIGGKSAVKEAFKFKNKHITELHSAIGCAAVDGDKKLAVLFNVRTRYAKAGPPPALGFGSIVREERNGTGKGWTYAFCLMPVCDSIRLDGTSGIATSFPFWDLCDVKEEPRGRGIVVESPKGTFLHLVAEGKPSDRLWMASFQPDTEAGVVLAENEPPAFVFKGSRLLEWVAQTKPAHAQRIAQDIGQKLSRVGLSEAEWLRVISEGAAEK